MYALPPPPLRVDAFGARARFVVSALLALGTACSDATPETDAGPRTDTGDVGPDGGRVGPDGGPVGPDGGPVGPDGGPVGPDGGPVGPDGGGGDTGPDGGPDPLRPDNRSRDSDCDGLSDQEEFANIYANGQKTAVDDPDTDGDGLLDGLELGRTEPVAGSGCAAVVDLDPSTTTLPVVADTDGDGLPDGVEDANRDGRRDANETDPRAVDTDGDGLPDGVEDANRNGRREAGETSPIDRDTDGDGIADGVEDRDRDGARSSEELDPRVVDTDGEGLSDGDEDANFNGLRERFETDGVEPDTDCDGLSDADELAATPPTSPLLADTDGDGLPDGVEVGASAAVPGSRCAPAPTLDADPTTTTSVDAADTDQDGLDDGVEDANGNGRVDPGETDPNAADSDGDGLSDGDEVRAGFDPTDGTDPGSTTGIADICSDANLKVVDFDTSTGRWTLANERSTAYAPITVASAGSGVDVAALDDATNAVAGFVLEQPLLSGPATLSAQLSALEARIDAGTSAAGLTYAARSSPRSITSHDGFPTAVSGFVDVNASADRNASAIRNRLLGLVTNLPASAFTGLPTTTGSGARQYVYGFQVLLRSNPDRMIVVGAVLERSAFDTLADRRGFVLTDLVNGTALARDGAPRDKDCDPFTVDQPPKADFIWMADISGSTDDDRGRITSASRAIFQALSNNGVDFRMGVVPHSQNSITRASGGNLRGNGFTTNETQFVADLENTSGADGCEFGLTAASDAIQRALPRSTGSTVDARKFRSDSAVAVVYLSDEFADEIQDNGCNGYTPSCTTGIQDYYANNDDSVCRASGNQGCIDSIVQPFINELAQVRGLAFAQVIAPVATPTNCTGYGCGGQNQNEPGRGYIEVVNATGGVFYSPCANDPGNALQQIVDAVTGAASQFQLSGDPISSTLRVGVVRGTSVTIVPRDKQDGFDYDPVSNSVFFRGSTYRPSRGDRVIVSYRLWEPAPEPCPPGQLRDPALGICVCDLAACSQNCGANEICDSNCACACAPDCNGNCGADEVCNQTSCACECAADCGGCPVGTTCNQATCQCECNDCGGACDADLTSCNAATCACECNDCEGACSGNSVCNDSLCECACPADCAAANCSGFEQCDPAQNCACVCPANCDGQCSGTATCNQAACACECPADCDAACPGNERCNPNNGCACECPLDCGGCAANERCDIASCQCVPDA